MAWVATFLHWCNQRFASEGPPIVWYEPAVGAKARWAGSTRSRAVMFLALFVLLAVIACFAIAPRSGTNRIFGVGYGAALTALVYGLSWVGTFFPTKISVSRSRILIGSGRGQQRIGRRRIGMMKLVTIGGDRIVQVEGRDGEVIERLFLSTADVPRVVPWLKENHFLPE